MIMTVIITAVFLDLTTVMSGNATLFVRLLVKPFVQSQ